MTADGKSVQSLISGTTTTARRQRNIEREKEENRNFHLLILKSRQKLLPIMERLICSY